MGTKYTFELKLLSEVPLHTSPMFGKAMVYISWDLSFLGEVPCVPWAKGHEARSAGAPPGVVSISKCPWVLIGQSCPAECWGSTWSLGPNSCPQSG